MNFLHDYFLNSIEIRAFCRRYHIKKLAVFGSVLGEAFSPDSDIDVLVEFESGFTPGLIKFAGLELEISRILGTKVDLRTKEDLSKYFHEEVVESAEVVYVASLNEC